MAFYESVLAFRGDLSEGQAKEKSAKYSQIIKELGGKIKSTEIWGLKPLAYIIRKNKRAHYVMFNMELDGAKVNEYERRMRIDEDVIRYLNVRVDKLADGVSIMMKKSESEGEE